MILNQIIQGDALQVLQTFPAESVDCCITSPPYWGLRDYGVEGQLGTEKTPEEYVAGMVAVFREVRRVLKKEGTLWLNLGDTYAANRSYQVEDNKHRNNQTNHMAMRVAPGLKPKDLVGIPWLVAFALRADGWYLRQDIIWHKPNPMPESVTDRCTKAHEYIFLLSKSQRYYFNSDEIKEPMAEYEKARRLREMDQGMSRTYALSGDGKKGIADQSKTGAVRNSKRRQELAVAGTRNKRSVWRVATRPFEEAHFATFPEELIIPMIKAGCPRGGVVLDPFMGAGTTGLVARKLQRNYLGIELNPVYIEIARKRITEVEKQPVLI